VSTHLSRKELKQDNVALKVEATTHFLVTHRALAIKVGVAALAVLVLGVGSWFFVSSRRDAREQALSAALNLQSATVGAAQGAPGAQNFPTQMAKDSAISKAFNSIISQDSGSEEAYAAEYYLAGVDISSGKTDDALKKYDHVISGAGADYASLAKLAKAQLLFSNNKSSDAEALVKDLIAHPTAMVSKEQASMVLAQGIAASRPEEARKLLTPIADAHSDISQAASAALGELPQK
jgi:hypothetical protein